MSNNFARSTPKYRIPPPLKQGWNYIGDGKFHDPTVGSSLMKGRWVISSGGGSGKSFDKFQQSLHNK